MFFLSSLHPAKRAILIQIGRVTITLHFWFSNPYYLLAILYSNMLMNALFIHKYTKEYSGSQIYPHISLYTLSIQKYKYILFGGKISLLYIKYIPTLPAYSHAYMDTNYRGILAIIWPYRRQHITIILIWNIGIIRYAQQHDMLVWRPIVGRTPMSR